MANLSIPDATVSALADLLRPYLTPASWGGAPSAPVSTVPTDPTIVVSGTYMNRDEFMKAIGQSIIATWLDGLPVHNGQGGVNFYTQKDGTISTAATAAFGGPPAVALSAPLTGRALYLIYQLMTPWGAGNKDAIETELRTLLGGQVQLSSAIQAYGDGGQYYQPALVAVASMPAGTLASVQQTYPDPNGPQKWLAANQDRSTIPDSWPGVMAAIGQ